MYKYGLFFLLTAGTSILCANEPVSFSSVAKAHGLDKFHKVKRLAYTFNVKKPGLAVSRAWVWEPHSGRVTCEYPDSSGGVEKTTYSRKAGDHLSDPAVKKVDQWFVNDQFWLLFPLHVAWDPSVKVLEKGEQPLPLGSGTAHAFEVKYPEQGGYTPGDVYQVFVDGKMRIQEWIFRKGGQAEPSLVTRFTDYQQFGPLSIALEHATADESFRLWFSDVQVDTR